MSRHVNIVGVEVRGNVSRNPAKALLYGGGLTSVGFTDPILNPFLVFLDDADAVVRGSTIDNQVFKIRITLKEYRPNRSSRNGP